MRNIILSFVLVATTIILTSAQSLEISAVEEDTNYIVVDKYETPEKVQDSINELSETNTIKEIAWHEELKQTKVTLIISNDDTEKVVILDEEGKEVE